jgi:hypothetical protein
LRRQRRQRHRQVGRAQQGRRPAKHTPQASVVVFAAHALSDDGVEVVLETHAIGGVGALFAERERTSSTFKQVQHVFGEHTAYRRKQLLQLERPVVDQTRTESAC